MISTSDLWLIEFHKYLDVYAVLVVISCIIVLIKDIELSSRFRRIVGTTFIVLIPLFFFMTIRTRSTVMEHVCLEVELEPSNCFAVPDFSFFGSEGTLYLYVQRDRKDADVYLVGKKSYGEKKIIKRETLIISFTNTKEVNALETILGRKYEVITLTQKFLNYDNDLDNERTIRLRAEAKTK